MADKLPRTTRNGHSKRARLQNRRPHTARQGPPARAETTLLDSEMAALFLPLQTLQRKGPLVLSEPVMTNSSKCRLPQSAGPTTPTIKASVRPPPGLSPHPVSPTQNLGQERPRLPQHSRTASTPAWRLDCTAIHELMTGLKPRRLSAERLQLPKDARASLDSVLSTCNDGRASLHDKNACGSRTATSQR